MALPPNYLKAIAKLALRKRAQMQKFKKMKKAMTRKGKPKLRIV